MIIQSISNSSLTPLNTKKINFSSSNTNQKSIPEPLSSHQNKEDDKNNVKNAYRKGLITGVVISILASAADRFGEYLIKKNSPKLK